MMEDETMLPGGEMVPIDDLEAAGGMTEALWRKTRPDVYRAHEAESARGLPVDPRIERLRMRLSGQTPDVMGTDDVMLPGGEIRSMDEMGHRRMLTEELMRKAQPKDYAAYSGGRSPAEVDAVRRSLGRDMPPARAALEAIAGRQKAPGEMDVVKSPNRGTGAGAGSGAAGTMGPAPGSGAAGASAGTVAPPQRRQLPNWSPEQERALIDADQAMVQSMQAAEAEREMEFERRYRAAQAAEERRRAIDAEFARREEAEAMRQRRLRELGY